ncbi:MAG: polyphosphate polymerase domain-containing protein [Verrucomicrobia bacterium]|nr:polyphosphate polymerase domain-containing protein [Verrucomicrobiota bacterium]
MAVDKLQASRFELKYFVDEDTALRIRDFVRCHLDLDEYGVGKPDYAYPVHSVYLDTDDLKLFWATINGTKNRFKLRVRFYSMNPDAPVFFEIKYRINNCIRKQRGGVRRGEADAVFSGQMPDRRAIAGRDPKHVFALMRFCELVQEINAKPKAHVAYLREAYAPHNDNSARLTLDRHVRIEPHFDTHLSLDMAHPIPVWEHDGAMATTVVELKFTDRFPGWFGDLVRRFNLKQCGAAKYADGVERMRSMGITLHGGAGDGDQEFLLSKLASETVLPSHRNEF